MDKEILLINKRKKFLYVTDDEQLASKWQLHTKINTKDNKILYTYWNIFYGLEYFDALYNSRMIENIDNTINFEDLDSKDAIIYIHLIVSDFTGYLEINQLIDIYYQSDYHQIKYINDMCIENIRKQEFSMKLYDFNKVKKVLSMRDIIDKFFEHILLDNREVKNVFEVTPEDKNFFNDLTIPEILNQIMYRNYEVRHDFEVLPGNHKKFWNKITRLEIFNNTYVAYILLTKLDKEKYFYKYLKNHIPIYIDIDQIHRISSIPHEYQIPFLKHIFEIIKVNK